MRTWCLSLLVAALVLVSGCIRRQSSVAQEPDPLPAVTTFAMQPGDRAFYEGTVTLSGHSAKRDWTSTQSFTVSSLCLEIDAHGYHRIAQLWQLEPAEVEGEGPVSHSDLASLRQEGFNLDEALTREETEVHLRPSFLPAPPRAELPLGLTFLRDRLGGSRGPIPAPGATFTARCEVTGEADVDGTPCVVVEISSTEPLPAEMKPSGMYEGGPPPKLTVDEYHEAVWVCRRTGWVVRHEFEAADTWESERGTRESRRGYTVSLVSRDPVADAELAAHDDQVARLKAIKLHGSGGNYGSDLAEEARIGLEKLAAFREDYPDSPYAATLPYLEERLNHRLAWATESPEEASPPPKIIGTKAPAFLGRDVDGSLVGLKDFAGEPLFLFFTDGNSDKAKEAGPVIAELHREFAPKGLKFCGVSRGNRDLYKRNYGLAFPIITTTVLAPANETDEQAKARGELLRDIPNISGAYEVDWGLTVVAIDDEGTIRHYRRALYPSKMRAFLTDLLDE